MSSWRDSMFAAPATPESLPRADRRTRRLIAGDRDWLMILWLLAFAYSVLTRPSGMNSGPAPARSWYETLPREYGETLAIIGPALLAIVSVFGQLSARMLGLVPERRSLQAAITILLTRSIAPTLGFFVFLKGQWMQPFFPHALERGTPAFFLAFFALICGPWLFVPALAIVVRHSPLHDAWTRRLGIQV